MNKLLLLIVSLVAILAISCKKEDNLCPKGYVDIYKTGSAKVIVTYADTVKINDIEKGFQVGYKSCEVISLSAVALEDNTTLRVNGGIYYLSKGEAVDLTKEILPHEYR